MPEQEARDDAREALAQFLHQRRHPCGEPPVDPDYEFADEVLTTLAPYRRHPEPETEYAHAANGYWNDDETEFTAEEYLDVSGDARGALAERRAAGPWLPVGKGE